MERFDFRGESGRSGLIPRKSGAARRVVRYEPDVLIVYSGHNEFIEKSFFRELRTRTETIGGLDRMLARSRIYSLLSSGFEKVAKRENQPTANALDIFVRRDRGQALSDEERSELVTFFGDNLRAICRLARENDVRVVLCTTPANLKDWRPGRAPEHPMLPEDIRAKWETATNAAVLAQSEGRWAEALERCDFALTLARRR